MEFKGRQIGLLVVVLYHSFLSGLFLFLGLMCVLPNEIFDVRKI